MTHTGPAVRDRWCTRDSVATPPANGHSSNLTSGRSGASSTMPFQVVHRTSQLLTPSMANLLIHGLISERAPRAVRVSALGGQLTTVGHRYWNLYPQAFMEFVAHAWLTHFHRAVVTEAVLLLLISKWIKRWDRVKSAPFKISQHF